MFTYKFYQYDNPKRECLTIKAVSSYEGKTITAIAELHPEDVNNPKVGTEIAKLRCQKKLCKKKIQRFKRKRREIDEEIEFYKNYIKKLEKRKEAYKKTISDTECLMMESDAALNKLINN